VNLARPQVVWVADSLPIALKEQLERVGLSPDCKGLSEIDPSDPRLRAVLIPFNEKAKDRIPTLYSRIRNSGAFFGIVANSAKEHTQAYRIWTKLAADADQVFEGFSIVSNDISEILRKCLYFEPGRAVNPNLVVETKNGSLGWEEKTLFQRAFCDFTRIVLERQAGGHADQTSVWKVEAHFEGVICEPFLAKMGPLRALKEEYLVWKDFVLDHTPFPLRAPLVSDRFVVGRAQALLVSMFVTRAQRLDKYLASVDDPQMTLSCLFGTALRSWRTHRAQVRNSLGKLYASQSRVDNHKHVVPHIDRLGLAFRLARRSSPRTPSPLNLQKILESLPAMSYQECRSHGDLNARNIFVRWNGFDVIIIDFSHADCVAAASRDLARLEVSIAFDVMRKWGSTQNGRRLGVDDLTATYAAPLLPPRVANVSDSRKIAIAKIREIACGEGISEKEYRLTTAAHLLRYARASRAGDDSPEQVSYKATAYKLAADLIQSFQ